MRDELFGVLEAGRSRPVRSTRTNAAGTSDTLRGTTPSICVPCLDASPLNLIRRFHARARTPVSHAYN